MALFGEESLLGDSQSAEQDDDLVVEEAMRERLEYEQVSED
jgi:hypothetical protein